MRRIDELFTAWPFLGCSSRMTTMLRAKAHPVNPKRIQRRMRKMGICRVPPEAAYTKPAPGHKIFPLSAARSRHRSTEPGLGH